MSLNVYKRKHGTGVIPRVSATLILNQARHATGTSHLIITKTGIDLESNLTFGLITSKLFVSREQVQKLHHLLVR